MHWTTKLYLVLVCSINLERVYEKQFTSIKTLNILHTYITHDLSKQYILLFSVGDVYNTSFCYLVVDFYFSSFDNVLRCC